MRAVKSICCGMFALGANLALATAAPERVFEFTYELQATEFPSAARVDIYLPLAVEDSAQQILDESIDASLPGRIDSEADYGNRYYHISRAAGDDTPITARLRWKISRAHAGADKQAVADSAMEKFLAPNELVPVGHEILQPILQDIHSMRADESPAATARAIYDWVVDNVEYKKVGTGWGNGDTFWACNERYGNCTDFHALFISLARSEGIPARFEIGFPVPESRDAGDIGGYHCWVKFYLPERGWVPIDASEAAKHPHLREALFGSQPADRIHFSTGRDLTLSQGSERQPLNYFIYPYVEIDGQPWQGKLETRFQFRAVEAVAGIGD